jgi:DNA-binding NarL/FixJ family response regulator
VDHKKINVLVCDAHSMSAELIVRALDCAIIHGYAVTARSVDHANLEKITTDWSPDILLFSLVRNDAAQNHFHAMRRMKQVHAELGVLLLLDSPEKNLIIEAFRSGATGVLYRGQPFDALCKAIVSVHEGQVWARSEDLHFLLEALSTMVSTKVVNARGTSLLSEREQQVLRLVSEGLTNKEIAKTLNLSEHTVKNYLFRMFDKLGVSTRVELILYAVNQSVAA